MRPAIVNRHMHGRIPVAVRERRTHEKGVAPIDQYHLRMQQLRKSTDSAYLDQATIGRTTCKELQEWTLGIQEERRVEENPHTYSVLRTSSENCVKETLAPRIVCRCRGIASVRFAVSVERELRYPDGFPGIADCVEQRRVRLGIIDEPIDVIRRRVVFLANPGIGGRPVLALGSVRSHQRRAVWRVDRKLARLPAKSLASVTS